MLFYTESITTAACSQAEAPRSIVLCLQSQGAEAVWYEEQQQGSYMVVLLNSALLAFRYFPITNNNNNTKKYNSNYNYFPQLL